MTEALREHGPVPHRDHDHEGEREQAEDLPDREASGEASGQTPKTSGETSWEILGELFDRHIGRGFPRRTNVRLRARRRRLTFGGCHRFGECHR
jgi:hypothetical protein